MKAITFRVDQEEDGSYFAAWDNPVGGGITTVGDTLAELQANVMEAVECHFEEGKRPAKVMLHFERDMELVAA